ncbi:hypothetical protein [Streptomyces mexicanus]|uniref:Uncharacterized protein n=1 Tax=Streptomyces mexicanus TaxID=178566 RepID=A0A7X1LSR1_9ACTN|nr:hypothetical protein [Streptomyces mexicanus]MBC2868373.1 hypothetical protein [Streptomyces mexicanus]
MTSPDEQNMSHPLEQVTGEKDVHPEEDAQKQAAADSPDEEEAGSRQDESGGGAPEGAP